MPRVEHHQLRAHSGSTKSFVGRSRVYLRQEDDNTLPSRSRILPPTSVRELEERGLLGDVLGAVETVVKSVTDLLGITGNSPAPAPPAPGGSSTSSSPGSATANPTPTQAPSTPTSSPASPTTTSPSSGNTSPGTGNGGGSGDGGGSGNTPNTSATAGPPSPPPGPSSSTDPSIPGSTSANQGTPTQDASESSPAGSTGTPLPDASDDSHFQGSPNLPADAAGDGNGSGTSIGAVANAGLNVLTGANGGASGTGTGASTTDANGNVVPVSPTLRPDSGGTSAATSSMRIGVGVGVTLAILTIFATLFFLRKRRIAKKRERRQRWWSSRRRGPAAESSENYGDEKADLPPPQNPTGYSPGPSNSNNNKTSTVPSSPFSPTFPSPPPLAEIRKHGNLIDHPVTIPSPSSEARPLSTASLISLASSTNSSNLPPMSFTTVTLSEESGSTGQSYRRFSSPPPSSDEAFLTFRHISPPPSSDGHSQLFRHSNTSPPPSSDEHFGIPNPRIPAQAAIDRTSAYFQPRSPTLSRSSSTVSGNSSTAGGSASAPRTLNIQISSSTGHGHERDSNPFADPSGYDISDLPQQSQLHRISHDGSASLVADKDSLRYSVPDSLSSNARPMSGSNGCDSLIASSCYNNFEEFEIVHVSFMGNLSDELSLRRGDEVRVLKIFEDGWALVVRGVQDGAQDAERGVIPVVCLSERLAGTSGLIHPERRDSYTMSAFIG